MFTETWGIVYLGICWILQVALWRNTWLTNIIKIPCVHAHKLENSCRLPQTPVCSSTLSLMNPLPLPTITHQCWVPTGTLLVSAVCLASHVTSGRGLYRAHGRFIVHLTCCALCCNYIHVFAFMHSVFIAIPSKWYFYLPINLLLACTVVYSPCLSASTCARVCACVCHLLVLVCECVCVCVCVYLCTCVCLHMPGAGHEWGGLEVRCTTAGESPFTCSTWTWCRGLWGSTCTLWG